MNWEEIADFAQQKEKWLKKIKQNYHISFAIDDDYDNCQMFFNNGIPALYPMYNVFHKKIITQNLAKTP